MTANIVLPTTGNGLIPPLLPRLNPYIPITPTPKQSAFLLLECLEALYGGALGGGKSAALLAAALQYVDVPGYNAILFRETLADLEKPEALIPLSHEWLGNTDAEWNERKHMWRFPAGPTLTFGYLEHPGDVRHYQGAAFTFLGFDEVTRLREYDYKYLFTRLRKRTSVRVPTRFRAATNPGGPGEEWVHRRFIDEGPRDGRVFIPAKLEDNPYLNTPEYRATLEKELDDAERRQLLEGEWGITATGNTFDPSWFEILPGGPPLGLGNMHFVRYWDLAAAAPSDHTIDPDWTVGVLLGEYKPGEAMPWDDGRSGVGIFYILDVRRFRLPPRSRDWEIQQAAEKDPPGTLTVVERTPGVGNEVTERILRDVLRGFRATRDSAVGNKELRADAVSATAQRRNLKIAPIRDRSWITPLLKELAAFPWGSHDDQVDALGGAFRYMTRNMGTSRQSLSIITREEINRRNRDRRLWGAA